MKLLQKYATRSKVLGLNLLYLVLFILMFVAFLVFKYAMPSLLVGGQSNPIKYNYTFKLKEPVEFDTSIFKNVYAETEEQCKKSFPIGVPDLERIEEEFNALCFDNYVSLFDIDRKNTLVSGMVLNKYKLKQKMDFKPSNTLKPFDFSDKQLITTANSFGYPIGQFLPSMYFTDKTGNDDSLYTTNIGPMHQVLASGVWKQLDYSIAKTLLDSGAHDFYIISGSAYVSPDSKSADNLGVLRNGVNVPTHYYKIIVEPLSGKSAAYLFPNTQNATGHFKRFLIPQQKLEEIIKVKFFKQMDSKLRKKLRDESGSLNQYLK